MPLPAIAPRIHRISQRPAQHDRQPRHARAEARQRKRREEQPRREIRPDVRRVRVQRQRRDRPPPFPAQNRPALRHAALLPRRPEIILRREKHAQHPRRHIERKRGDFLRRKNPARHRPLPLLRLKRRQLPHHLRTRVLLHPQHPRPALPLDPVRQLPRRHHQPPLPRLRQPPVAPHLDQRAVGFLRFGHWKAVGGIRRL